MHPLYITGVVAILVLQAIVVLTLLHLWQLKLVVDVERARLGNILALIGLPGPILRIMHAKPVNVRRLVSGSVLLVAQNTCKILLCASCFSIWWFGI